MIRLKVDLKTIFVKYALPAIIVGCVFAFVLYSIDFSDSAVDYLRGEIDEMDWVSDDYRQGWLDCVKELEDYRGGIENLTAKADIVDTVFHVREDGTWVENKTFMDVNIGIVVWSDNNNFLRCTFINCDDEGVLLFGDDNVFLHCVFYNCCDGVELQGSCNNSFWYCTFVDCYHMGVDGLGDDNYGNSFKFCRFVDSWVWFNSWNDNDLFDCNVL